MENRQLIKPVKMIPAVLWCALLVVIELIAAVMFANQVSEMPDEVRSISYFVLSLISLNAVLYLVGRKNPYIHRVMDLENLKKIDFRLVWPVLVAALGFAMFNTMIGNNLYENVQFFKEVQDTYSSALEGNVLVVLVFIVLLNPFFEELLFRGFLLTGLYKAYGKTFAIILVSVLFAAIHINPIQIICVFIFGFLLNYLMLETFNIYYTIICHAAYNFFVVAYATMVAALPTGRSLELVRSNNFSINLLDLAGLAILLFGWWLLVSALKKSTAEKPGEQTPNGY